ncbi:uncharacterized protein EV420DRAFT_1653514 [Desarmillaria tabescens]|uniref:F-box domain-containing protein n=1 Tax=Armillaria tabescens TaxID=1929756 RepID=A0AA39J639_ARMTA|nr:uncharacterized protein EV420DRAFT_1653514 [Desarmillaria tabescens]KAK0434998.1 hypothetical protein EV420DRAFT_1653514 [Desarmillaria tabescens]
MTITLNNLPDDLLIDAIAFLSVPDILFLCQACTRFNTFKLNILSNDYPCPINDTDHKQRTCHAYRLATRWLADYPMIPTSIIKFTASPASDIKFIPGWQHKWILIVSEGIRTVLTIWDVARAHKCSEWLPKGGKLFTKIILNEDPESEVSIVVALYGSERILFLHLDDDGALHKVHDIDVGFHPVSMTGDVIAFSDDISKALIYNWKTEEQAYLDDGGDMQDNDCNHIIFAPTSIDCCHPHQLSQYLFDWHDHTSATPTSLLTLSESYRLWTLETNLFQLYSLASVPPMLLSRGLSRHCVLSYVDMVLGKRGTAVWISPEECATAEYRGCKTLIAAIFPGPLNAMAEVRIHELCSNTPNNWDALDYDEELGRIALGSCLGEVTIVQL